MSQTTYSLLSPLTNYLLTTYYRRPPPSSYHLLFTTSFLQTTYSLFMLPYFLMFISRPLMGFVTHARPTGYDRAGVLCAALSDV